ncbi:hypothetical protein DS901_15705 [Loktanella sp. D2R18]|uniref:hypothetical protein n=1 Tax=Rhodobacterales TaxID=204455 RepID=UPI000DEACE9F|nr:MULTISPECIES: hypothetical protein [Rhodobacterales]MDO6591093.1 hypothetical protein [Yoonia sp. 1_MG-2023]RBW42157.1 hypothetical protein DS901_15705 [Loktanella sp. D2R18]
MAIVTLPEQTAKRLSDRISALDPELEHRVFAASDIVMGIAFTERDTAEFKGETGVALILAVKELAGLTKAIPEFEDGQRNYCIIKNTRAVARLDPFFAI